MSRLNSEQFDKLKRSTATKEDVEKAISEAEIEITDWTQFKEHCELLLEEKKSK
tara:strand:- start:201 stop:362 length:162 start_codon:yes stop_codon:yes gene_type:complete